MLFDTDLMRPKTTAPPAQTTAQTTAKGVRWVEVHPSALAELFEEREAICRYDGGLTKEAASYETGETLRRKKYRVFQLVEG